MATRGRIKGWKSPKAVAAMSPEEREAYEDMIAKAKAEREAEKRADLIAKGIDPDEYAEAKKVQGAKKEEKVINLQNLINSQLKYQQTHIMSQDEDEEEKNGKPWYATNDSMGDVKETTIDHLSGEGFCTIETNEDFWIRKIAEMIEKTPDKVIVLDSWCNEDMLRVKIPYSAMKKIKTQSRIISEEQRQRMSELGKTMGKKRGRPRKNEVKENDNDILGSNGNDGVSNPDADISQSNSPSGLDFVDVSEESDEEFEGTPMNIHRNYDGEEPDIKEEELSNEEDDIAYAVTSPMSFGKDVTRMREHEIPKVIHCDTADNEDYELNEDDEDYDKYE